MSGKDSVEWILEKNRVEGLDGELNSPRTNMEK